MSDALMDMLSEMRASPAVAVVGTARQMRTWAWAFDPDNILNDPEVRDLFASLGDHAIVGKGRVMKPNRVYISSPRA